MDLTAITFTALRFVVADGAHFGRAAARCHVSKPLAALVLMHAPRVVRAVPAGRDGEVAS